MERICLGEECWEINLRVGGIGLRFEQVVSSGACMTLPLQCCIKQQKFVSVEKNSIQIVTNVEGISHSISVSEVTLYVCSVPLNIFRSASLSCLLEHCEYCMHDCFTDIMAVGDDDISHNCVALTV